MPLMSSTADGDRHAHRLLARARTGDTHAVLGLFDIYAGPLFAHLATALGDPEEAEAVLSDVFAHVSMAEPPAGDEPLGPWLLRLAGATA